MKKYNFSGEIQGRYRQIEISPIAQLTNHYLIHWDGFEVGVIKKEKGKWHTDHEALVDFKEELGDFIENRKSEIAESE
ncbi:hypothetical protein SAMN06265348_104119 [Pedobacter westerhofensis]|uniref:Uncharacterized protein n=1 Tax=Pedobacter westerhofensis TaxID=425512 RepID=A0A521CQG8_9SPHI|nr:hypothetical protein [Pedobacter westerhofensis]SMO61707.1 hypothetical protein SAMN06265348_104119 [Pedobacter westerhofensis]